MSGNLGLEGGNNITLSQSSGASSTRLVISAASQSVQPVGSAIATGNTTGTTASIPLSGNLGLEGGANVTISQSSGASSTRLVISAASQSVQPVGSLGLSGNTTGTTASLPLASNFKLAGGPNITLSQSSGTNSTVISVSADNPQTGISSIVGSDATYTSGSVQFTGSNMITVKSSANQRIVIDATQSVQPVGSIAATGNTTGTMATLPLSGSIGIAGGANITISQSTGAASTNLSIIGPAPGGGAAFTLSGSNTSYSNSAVLSGSNAATVKSTTGNAFIIDVPTQTVAPVGSIAATGNTTGTMATLPLNASIGLEAGNNITISQSTGGTSTRFVFSAPNTTVQTVNTLDYFDNAGAIAGASGVTQTAMTFNTLLVQPLTPFNEAFPGAMTVSTAMLQFSISATASSSHSSTIGVGIYTRKNATQLSLLNSVQTTWAQAAATNQTASYHGQRWITIHSSLWSSTPAFSQGQYWMAVFARSSNASHTGSFIGQVLQNSVQRSGSIMSSVATNQSMQHYPFMGIHATSQTAFPASIGATQINAATALGPFVPNFVFNNITVSF
jgi:hypothetical protein